MTKKGFDPHPTDPKINALIEKMPNIRVTYSKTGPAKYISHLDITRCMQRSLKRAGIPVWYTQGFNPHMYMTFALPLALGYESLCEVMDLRITEMVDFKEMKAVLQQALPPDIRVLDIAMQEQKPQEIGFADYRIVIPTAHTDQVATLLQQVYDQAEILVEKRTKKGIKQIDIKPDLSLTSMVTKAGQVIVEMRTVAGQRNINPTLFTDEVVRQYEKPLYVGVTRLALYDMQAKPWK